MISIFLKKCIIPNFATMCILGTPSRNNVARGSTSVQAPDGSKKKNKHALNNLFKQLHLIHAILSLT